MAKPLTLPFPPLVVLAHDGALDWAWLEPRIKARLDKGISLCLTRSAGENHQGGYFFHIKKTPSGFAFSTFDRSDVLEVSTDEECVEFMNHVAGRVYSAGMWDRCQGVNLRSDDG